MVVQGHSAALGSRVAVSSAVQPDAILSSSNSTSFSAARLFSLAMFSKLGDLVVLSANEVMRLLRLVCV